MIDAAHAWQERRVGRTTLKLRRARVDLDDIVRNVRQPRLGRADDPELQRQIVESEGVSEPLLLEPHPTLQDKFQIIDGDHQWSNAKVLYDQLHKASYRSVPADITQNTLDEEERLRVWIYIQKQRKEWDAEKEKAAYEMVKLVGRASTANIIGVSVRELDKHVDIYELAMRLTNIRDPGASITWAREIKSIKKNLLTPTVLDTIVAKVNDKLITNSKDVRKLRSVLRDPIARDRFLTPGASINDALEKIEKPQKKNGLAGDLGAIADSIRKHPWTTLAELRGDQETLRTIDEVEKLLKQLKKTLKS